LQNTGERYFARGGEVQTLEGAWNPRNIIIVEFRSMMQARAWYQSPEYGSALEVRDVALERNLILVDGYRESTHRFGSNLVKTPYFAHYD
jgi:uncharacterized protein (DUF1330 family)